MKDHARLISVQARPRPASPSSTGLGLHRALLSTASEQVLRPDGTRRQYGGQPPVPGGPETDYGTGVHVGDDFMLRIPEDHEHRSSSHPERCPASDVFDPCEVGTARPPARPALSSSIGHPGLRDVRSSRLCPDCNGVGHNPPHPKRCTSQRSQPKCNTWSKSVISGAMNVNLTMSQTM